MHTLQNILSIFHLFLSPVGGLHIVKCTRQDIVTFLMCQFPRREEINILNIFGRKVPFSVLICYKTNGYWLGTSTIN